MEVGGRGSGDREGTQNTAKVLNNVLIVGNFIVWSNVNFAQCH
jgi:hypothetical protein